MINRLQFKSLPILFCVSLAAANAFAAEKYEANFNVSYVAKYIGRDLKKDLNGKSLAEKQGEIVTRQAADANIYSCFYGRTFIPNKEFFIQDAFVDRARYGLEFNSQNWMAAWFSLLEETILNTPDGQRYPDYVNDPELISKISQRVAAVSAKDDVTDYSYPSLTDPDIRHGFLMYANDSACELTLRTYYRTLHRIASPLYLWLLQQPNKSVSPLDLFKEAKSIYKDSWVALGIIGFITGHDAGNLANNNRKKLAVTSFKMSPVFQNATDHAGTIYHFWGFALRSVFKNGAPTENFLSFMYEGVYQRDAQDRAADALGISVGKQILDYIKTSKNDSIHF